MPRRELQPSTLAAALLAALLACASLLAAPREAPADAANEGRIVFSEEGDIFAVDPAGTGGPARLTDDPAEDLFPSVSPDGSEIAWERDGEIWRMRADGSGETKIVGRADAGPGEGSYSEYAHDPAWSPDGSEIAFDRDYDIWAVAADGSGERRITEGGDQDLSPSWSPEGGRIAFERAEESEPDLHQIRQIFTADADDGSGAEAVSVDAPFEGSYDPDWSPDGSEIAFWGFGASYVGNYQAQIYVARADGSGVGRVAGGVRGEPYDYHYPSFSPDGSRIALGDGALYTMDRDGTDKRLVLDDTGRIVHGSQPDWGVEPPPDATAPAIASPRPVPGSQTRDRTPTVRAAVRDAATELAASDVKLRVDGARKSFFYDQETDRLSHATGQLSYGRHRVKIAAEDAAGNVAKRVWSFRVVRWR